MSADQYLLPCPFCGSEDAVCVISAGEDDPVFHWVVCGLAREGCGSAGPSEDTVEGATWRREQTIPNIPEAGRRIDAPWCETLPRSAIADGRVLYTIGVPDRGP